MAIIGRMLECFFGFPEAILGFVNVLKNYGYRLRYLQLYCRIVSTLFAVLLLGLLSCTSVNAATYSLTDDFSATLNPSGPWQYGWLNVLNGTFTKYSGVSSVTSTNGANFQSWYDPNNNLLGTPSIVNNSSGIDFVSTNVPPATFPTGWAGFHPGQNNELSTFRFTAPQTGTYLLSFEFQGADSKPTSTNVHVNTGGSDLYTATINGYGTASLKGYSGTVSLSVNQVVDIAVDCSINGCMYDSTSVRGTISLKDSAVVVGPYHACYLNNNGVVYCWGDNTYGQLGNNSTTSSSTPVLVKGLTSPVIALAAGDYHTCALNAGGGVQCWGRNGLYLPIGALGNNSTANSSVPVQVTGLTSGVVAIVAAGSHTCALTNTGSVMCWGENTTGSYANGTVSNSLIPVQVQGFSGLVTSIATGANNTCAVTTNAVQCWGDPSWQQLGATTLATLTPTTINGLTGVVKSIAVGEYHICVLNNSGNLQCWGSNLNGELGNSTNLGSSNPVPTQVDVLAGQVAQVSAGYGKTCVITNAGGVQCWGAGYGYVPTQISSLTNSIKSISTGLDFDCSLNMSEAVLCWGYNVSGMLGSVTFSATPVQIMGLSSVMSAVAVGGGGGLNSGDHACGLLNSGSVQCWGNNFNGQLGNGTTTYSSTPVAVSGLSDIITAITTGGVNTCALTNIGGVQCWGYNYDGELGNTTSIGILSTTPVTIPGLSGVNGLTAGSNHICVLSNAGGAQCWGDNLYGQLGNGSTFISKSILPVNVSQLTTGVSAISANTYHTCALISGGVKCWGQNLYGELGNGTTISSNTPVQVVGVGNTGVLIGVGSVSSGGNHTCAVTATGGVLCWGYNSQGQLGNGTINNSSAPVQVLGEGGIGNLSGVTAISAGGIHTCALISGGVQCWGFNGYGELGNGSYAQSTTPVAVTGLTSGVIAISAGYNSTCAVTTLGVTWCWGSGYGSGTSIGSATPVLVKTNLPQSIAFYGQQPTTITIGNLGARTVNVSASSGLPVTLTPATPTICSVAGQLVTGLVRGTCILNANQPGDGSTFGAAQPVQLTLTVQAAPTYSLSGKVLGAGGIAMPNVNVILSDVNSNVVATIKTAADGSYSFSSLPAQSLYFDFSYTQASGAGATGSPYAFTIHHLDLGSGNMLLPLTSNTANYTLQLPFVAVTGHTVDINHVPVPNVPLTLDYYQNQPVPLSLNSAGTFTGKVLDSLVSDPAGNYTLWLFNPVSGIASWNLGWSAPANFTSTGTQILPAVTSTSTQDIILPYASTVVPPPLFLAGPGIPYLSNTSAVIEWETDEPSDTEVFYKVNTTNGACPTSAAANTTSGGPDTTPNAANMATHHIYYVSPLTSSTAYCYYAKSMISLTKGNSTFNTYPLTTLATPNTTDSLAPAFTSGPVVTATSGTTATLEWTTNKPAVWTVSYMKVGDILPTTVKAPTGSYALHQTVVLGNPLVTPPNPALLPSTVYTVTVTASDLLNNNSVTSDATNPVTFTTVVDTTPPVIVGMPLVTDLTDTQATVTWTTDKPTNSNLSYSDAINGGITYFVLNDGFPGTSGIVPEFRTEHHVRLTGLLSGHTYTVTVAPVDASGIAATPTAVTPFTPASTSTAPVILGTPDYAQLSDTTAMVHWLTDVPSDSVVTYGSTSGNVLNQTEAHGVLETEHSVLLSGLDPAISSYSYQVKSTSAAPSLTNSGLSSTPVTGTLPMTHPFTSVPPAKTICPNDQNTPQIIFVGSDRVTFEWCTNVPTDAYVECAPLTTPTALTRVSDPVQRTRHQITVTNLVMSNSPQCHGRSADLQGRAVTW